MFLDLGFLMRVKFFALWLSLIAVVMFILQNLFPSFTQALLLNQESWFQIYRFVTAIFLHGSLQHLTFNLFALILFGLILEKLIGTKKFLFVFFVSGVAANLISVNFYQFSLGASGAIFGILGALTVIRPRMVVWAFGLPMPIFVAAILWALADIIGIFNPSNIANIAHLAGIFFGLLLGLIFRLSKKTTNQYTYSYKVKIPENYIRSWEEEYLR